MPADSAVDAPDLLGRRTIEAIAALVESHCGALWLRSADGRAYEPAASWNMRDPGVTVSAESSLATFLREDARARPRSCWNAWSRVTPWVAATMPLACSIQTRLASAWRN